MTVLSPSFNPVDADGHEGQRKDSDSGQQGGPRTLRGQTRPCTLKYHKWMKSEELRTLTASEPLSLEEEYEMQRKWREDEDKLTFIVLARTNEQLSPGIEFWDLDDARLDALPMIGDVNLFLKGTPPTHVGTTRESPTKANEKPEEEDDSFEAEVEIMIAEPAYRRRGCASEALKLMLSYATHRLDLWITATNGISDLSDTTPQAHIWPTLAPSHPLPVPPECLVARVSDKNLPSISLLERLGFAVVKRVAVFEEVEMRWRGSDAI
ncbi:hypothetical protein AX16_006638 [Volvariella volvacea WC 439]|nr:hypothetical protein AX16_006638 [Volvariella volvacea WC 439]